MMRSILALFGTLALTACGSDFESKDDGPRHDAGADSATGGAGGSAGSSSGGTSGSGGTTGGSGGTGGGPSPCPSNHVCAPPAPADWNGPFALTSDPTCSGAWAQEQLVIHDGLTADPPECGCSCTPKTICPGSAGVVGFNSTSCDGSGVPSLVTTGTCKLLSGVPQHAVALGEATASCAPMVTENIPPATWAKNDRLCAGATSAGACENPEYTCLPDAGVSLCVEQIGDVGCPAEYPGKYLYYTNLDDTRNCPTTCPCTGSGSVECTASFHSFGDGTCNTGATQLAVKSGLRTCVGGALSVNVDSISSSKLGTCTPGAAVGDGEVAPKDPHTVCCLQ